MNRKELEQILVNEFGLNDIQLEQLYHYYELIIEESKIMNLTTITDLTESYIKHFYDSLLLTKMIDNPVNKSLLDIGSGAGFPGIVLKIFYPNLSITLIDSIGKKCDFLNKVIKELNLEKIKVINTRAEELVKTNRESYDFVTARAVAELNILLELAIPLVKKNGVFLSMKGSSYADEIQNSQEAVKKLMCKLDTYKEFSYEPYISKRGIIVYKKDTLTPKIYPRSYAQIKKKPL